MILYWVVVGVGAELALAMGAGFLLRRARLRGEDIYGLAPEDQWDRAAAASAPMRQTAEPAITTISP